MFEVIKKEKMGEDVYEEDVEVIEIKKYEEELLGKEESLFLNSGKKRNGKERR